MSHSQNIIISDGKIKRLLKVTIFYDLLLEVYNSLAIEQFKICNMQMDKFKSNLNS